MSLFRPLFLTCPICHPGGEKQSISYSYHTLEKAPDGQFICAKEKHKFSLYNSLQTSVSQGIFGILQAFSHASWATTVPAAPGNMISVKLPLIHNHHPFAVSTTPVNAPFHALSTIVSETEIAISTTALSHAPTETAPELSVMVWMHQNTSAGWQLLLYESLADYLQLRHSLAIFKLATAIEIFSDNVFEHYLRTSGGIAEHIISRIMREQRSSWNVKFTRLKDLGVIYLSSADQKRLTDGGHPFVENVRVPRNEFAHKGALTTDQYKQCEAAYKAAFEILWPLDLLSSATKPQ